MSIQTAVAEIERMSKLFKAFEEATNALKVLAGYEQNAAEMQKMVDDLKAEALAAQAEVGAIKAKNAEAKAKGEKMLAQATEAAMAAVAEAEVKATQLLDTANAEAQVIVEQAKREAQTLLDEAQAKAAASLADTQTKIEALKATAKNLLG